jgi:hypothetical protein
MKKNRIIGLLIFIVFCGCSSGPDPKRYGNNPYHTWAFANNSSHPLTVIIENGMRFTLDSGQQRKASVIDIINSGAVLGDIITAYDALYYGQPYKKWNQDNKYFNYDVNVLDGGKVLHTLYDGWLIIFIDSDVESLNEDLKTAVDKASEILQKSLPPKTTIALLNIASQMLGSSEFVIDRLEYLIVSSGNFKIVDRKTLDVIRQEQNFQMSGEVDDYSAVGIGNMLGANIVITGSISGDGTLRRLRLKALDVKTAEIVAMALEVF